VNVTLLECPSPFLIDERVFPPLGLMAVATALKRSGCCVTVRDKVVPWSDWYGIGPTVSQYPYAKKLLQEIKRDRPDARVMIGGPHASRFPERCLDDGFDLAVVGDGENLKPEMLTSGVVRLPERPLDDYPIIDRDVLDEGIHAYHYEIDGIPATSTVTSRGCPYRCAFCAKYSRQVRFRSADRVKDEIDYLCEVFGFRALMFYDDTFILRPERVVAICHHLRRLGVVWRCFVRGDLIVRHGRDFVRFLANCGCVEVAMGVESGSDTILGAIHKGETVAEIRTAVSWLDAAGIRVKGLFIVGLPGESHETLRETRQLVEELPFAALDFTVFQPYAGSPIWENRAEYDIDWGELSESHYKGRPGEYRCGVWTSSLTSEEIVAAREELEQAAA